MPDKSTKVMPDPARLRLFATLYLAKMEAKPFLEISQRYAAMTEAKLTINERKLAEDFIDTGRIDQLLNPHSTEPVQFTALQPGKSDLHGILIPTKK